GRREEEPPGGAEPGGDHDRESRAERGQPGVGEAGVDLRQALVRRPPEREPRTVFLRGSGGSRHARVAAYHIGAGLAPAVPPPFVESASPPWRNHSRSLVRFGALRNDRVFGVKGDPIAE